MASWGHWYCILHWISGSTSKTADVWSPKVQRVKILHLVMNLLVDLHTFFFTTPFNFLPDSLLRLNLFAINGLIVFSETVTHLLNFLVLQVIWNFTALNEVSSPPLFGFLLLRALQRVSISNILSQSKLHIVHRRRYWLKRFANMAYNAFLALLVIAY